MKPRGRFSLLLCCVYLLGALLVSVQHVAERTGGCSQCLSAGTLLTVPCPSHGPCGMPHHHHPSGTHRRGGLCPSCAGLLGVAIASRTSPCGYLPQGEQPLHSRSVILASLAPSDGQTARAPPLAA